MWIGLDNEESVPMIHEIKDSTGKPTGKQTIVSPTFDLYNKKVGDGRHVPDLGGIFLYQIWQSRVDAENKILKYALTTTGNTVQSSTHIWYLYSLRVTTLSLTTLQQS